LLAGIDLTRVGLSADRGQQARLAATPLATVTELIFEVFGRPKGSPAPWPNAVREALEPHDMVTVALAPVCGPGGPPFIPDCLLPRPETVFPSFDDELDRVAAVSADELVAELESADLLASAWEIASKAPRRWLDAYLLAIRLAWIGVRPWWERAAPLIEREVERVGVALASRSVNKLVSDLYPPGRADHDRGRSLPWEPPTALAPDLVLVPMVVGPGGSLVGTDGERICYLGYPLPGAHRLVTQDRPRRAGRALDALLGAPRADILRRLDRPATAGQLADELLFTPAAISHHLKALERAGLAMRERFGQRVLVHRSARGTALLHIYEA
jgi:DNA-binding transcriptional ArsR family regulator